MEKKYLDVITQVRGIFPENLHVGGSVALKEFFFNTEFIVPGDLDLFIYVERPCEKWVIDSILSSLFIVHCKGFNYTGKYKIEGQYWYYKCEAQNGVIFDLIFIRPSYVEDSIGSTLAGIQYLVTYSEKILATPKIEVLEQSMRYAGIDKICVSYARRNTELQLKKVRVRCTALGLNLKERN